MLAWSPGTRRPVEGPAVILPEVADSTAFAGWLKEVQGKFVLVSFPQPSCRPDSNWRQWATAETFERMRRDREAASVAWASLACSPARPAAARVAGRRATAPEVAASATRSRARAAAAVDARFGPRPAQQRSSRRVFRHDARARGRYERVPSRLEIDSASGRATLASPREF